MFFNTRFTWSVSPQGEAGRVDLESVVLHELGHVLGLGHSAIGETERTATGGRRVLASGAVMFPIAMTAGAIADRVLQPDDIAGSRISIRPRARLTPPAASPAASRRTARACSARTSSRSIPESGVLVGNFALNMNGEFAIVRLAPGPYVLRVEPLDDAEVDSFFSTSIDTDFRVTYALSNGGRAQGRIIQLH